MGDWGVGVFRGGAPGEGRRAGGTAGLSLPPGEGLGFEPTHPAAASSPWRAQLSHPVSPRLRVASLGLSLQLDLSQDLISRAYLPTITVYLGVFSPKITCAQ